MKIQEYRIKELKDKKGKLVGHYTDIQDSEVFDKEDEEQRRKNKNEKTK
jgi:hypothetical protein